MADREDALESDSLKNLNGQVSNLSKTVASLLTRIQDLEDTNSIRHLHHTYGYYIDKCFYPSVVDLVRQTILRRCGPALNSKSKFSQNSTLILPSSPILLMLQSIFSTGSGKEKQVFHVSTSNGSAPSSLAARMPRREDSS